MHSKKNSVILLILYFVGAAFWVSFLWHSNFSIAVDDWMNTHIHLNSLRQGLLDGIFPWKPFPHYQNGANFMANPEFPLTPDIFLLKWLTNRQFIDLHTLILYSLGFFGMLKIMRQMSAHIYVIVFFWLLFNFNGYITAHLAVGHFMWEGYFLLPLLFWKTMSLLEENENKYFSLSALCLSLIIGGLFLNGSFHIAIWCCMFLVLLLLWNQKIIRSIIGCIGLTALIASCRLVPAAIYFVHDSRLQIVKGNNFVTGYPDISSLLDAFITLLPYDATPKGGVFGALLWQEYSMYIGIVAFLVLILGLFFGFKIKSQWSTAPLVGAASCFLILSFENVYSAIANSPFPLIGVERISSRFIVFPFLLFLIIASVGLNDLFKKNYKMKHFWAFVILVFTCVPLKQNMDLWRVSNILNYKAGNLIPVVTLNENLDKGYEALVYSMLALSVLTVFLVLLRILTTQRTQVS